MVPEENSTVSNEEVSGKETYLPLLALKQLNNYFAHVQCVDVRAHPTCMMRKLNVPLLCSWLCFAFVHLLLYNFSFVCSQPGG